MFSFMRKFLVRFGFALSMAAHGVMANPLRSGLTVLSVIIGVGSVVTLISIGEGARQAVVQQFESLGENVIMIESQDSSIQFPAELAGQLLERVPSLQYATPVVITETQMRWRRARDTVEVLGVNSDFPLIRDHPVISGLFFSELHVQQRSPVAVLGYDYGVALMGGRSPVGQTITLGGRSFRIIGVLGQKGENQAGGIDRKILIPYTTAQLLAGKRTADQIWVKARSAAEADLAIAQLGRIFRRQVGLDPLAPAPGGGAGTGPGAPYLPGMDMSYDVGAVVMPGMMPEVPAPPGGSPGSSAGSKDIEELITITNLNQAVKSADQANRIMTLLLGGIAAVSLLVGGIGIMNIMLVSVSERTAEIGLRKAVGATRADLLTQFLLEAFLLSATGALLGLLIGHASAGIISRYGLDVVFTPEAAIIALGAALSVGVLFGGYPAWLASSLQPVEALRRR